MVDAWENGFYDLVGNSIGELKYKEISHRGLEEDSRVIVQWSIKNNSSYIY